MQNSIFKARENISIQWQHLDTNPWIWSRHDQLNSVYITGGGDRKWKRPKLRSGESIIYVSKRFGVQVLKNWNRHEEKWRIPSGFRRRAYAVELFRGLIDLKLKYDPYALCLCAVQRRQYGPPPTDQSKFSASLLGVHFKLPSFTLAMAYIIWATVIWDRNGSWCFPTWNDAMSSR